VDNGTRSCLGCGATITPPMSHRRRYCTQTCSRRSRGKTAEHSRRAYHRRRAQIVHTRSCPQCGTTIPVTAHANRRLCSTRCVEARRSRTPERRASSARQDARRRNSRMDTRWPHGRPPCPGCGMDLPAATRVDQVYCSVGCKERMRQRSAEYLAHRCVVSMQRRALIINRGVPFTIAQLAARLTMFSGCWMCGSTPNEVEHVKPLARGGWHMLANLRPACGRCNRRKGTRWVGVSTVALLRKEAARDWDLYSVAR